MSIRRKARSVEIIYRDLELKIEDFKRNTQLHCVAGCGFCCKNPEIEATAIEFLPLALHYYHTSQAEEKYDYFRENKQTVCHIFKEGTDPDAGFCTMYPYRGLICRLFGYSARKKKYGESEYSTCRKIKDTQPEKYIDAYLKTKNGLKIPLMGQYYQRLLKVDFERGQKFYPINIAIQKAIEMVLAYYSYRRNPSGLKQKDQNRGTMPSPGVAQDLISDPQ
jgi:Fe-S-cluster containining protein